MASGAYVIHRVISNAVADPEREKHEQASSRAKAHLERLQREKDRRRGQDGARACEDDGAGVGEELDDGVADVLDGSGEGDVGVEAIFGDHEP